MKRALVALLIAVASSVGAAQEPARVIPPHSRVYIVPMDGFENYLAAAFAKRKVPLLIVNTKELADFEITGNSEMKKAGWARTVFGSGREVNASIQVVNIETGIVAYAVASHKGDAWTGLQSAAETIAKNVRQKIHKDHKKARRY